MTANIATLVADNLDIWTSATVRKSGAGRGGGKRISLYGIERLRALILDLAVRGKLVPQDAGDEPVGELLKRIAKSKAAMIRDGIIRKPRELEDKATLKPPFQIPESWRWITLDQAGAIVGGGTPSSNDAACLTDGGAGIAWLTPADLGGFSGRYIAHGVRDLTEYGLKTSSATLMPEGTVLFTSRAPIGYVAIATNPVTTNQGFKSIVPYISDSSLFIATALKSFAKGINDSAPGTTFKEVSGKIVAAVPFPLPPLAEQRRIVAKVDELMALCDALERESAGAIATHQALVEELLATLVNSADAADLATNWTRLETHFDTLFTTDASIDALKQTILDLAVRGKLVEQDKGDGSSQVLLGELGTQCAKMEKDGLVAKRRHVDFPREWKPAFAIPNSWVWECFGNYTAELATGPFGTMIHQSDYVSGGIPLINPSHMIEDRIVEDPSVAVPTAKALKLESYLLRAGDIVFARRGEVGRLAIVTEREAGWLCGTGSFRARFASQDLQQYLALFFRARYARDILGGESVGATMSNLNHTILNRLPLPIPPLAEQQRIVAKVDALMAHCDALKARITDAAQTQRHLADAITERAAA